WGGPSAVPARPRPGHGPGEPPGARHAEPLQPSSRAARWGVGRGLAAAPLAGGLRAVAQREGVRLHTPRDRARAGTPAAAPHVLPPALPRAPGGRGGAGAVPALPRR